MKRVILIFSVLCLIFFTSCQISVQKDTDKDDNLLTDLGTNEGLGGSYSVPTINSTA